MPLRVAISGTSGRMGRTLIESLAVDPDVVLVGALDAPDSALIGSQTGVPGSPLAGVVVTSDLAEALSGADILIDFTRPAASLLYARHCAEQHIGMVIGTTGFTPAQRSELERLALKTAIVLAPNMSIGVNITMKLIELAAQAFSADYDVEILETHHRHKVDAPSGTALQMGEIVAAAHGDRLDDVAVYGRRGTGEPRGGRTIGFSSMRGGDVVGDHTVVFAGTAERVEITHRSSSRAGYAQGAIAAAKFAAQRDQGLYDMQDVLALRTPAPRIDVAQK